MKTSTKPQHSLAQITLTLAAVGLLAGFVVAFGVLAGDQQGRVNLLYLLLLFAFLPVAGLVLSLVTLATGSGSALSRLVLRLPVWPGTWRRQIMALARDNAQKPWFLYQSQVLALGFGTGGLLAFFILLLASDINFVWRSTLLRAEDLLPWLRGLALPWLAWEEAQPSLALLRETQDFRLAAPDFDRAALGQWWKYVFAAQCTYNLLPRTVMLLVFRHYYLEHLQQRQAPAPEIGDDHAPLNRVPDEGSLAGVENTVSGTYRLINWADAPGFCLERVAQTLGQPAQTMRAGPLASPEEEEASLLPGSTPVVLVKSWEPPLGELKDYLEAAGGGYLLPLDWDEQAVRTTGSGHLHEWRRFCGALDRWRLLQLTTGRAAA